MTPTRTVRSEVAGGLAVGTRQSSGQISNCALASQNLGRNAVDLTNAASAYQQCLQNSGPGSGPSQVEESSPVTEPCCAQRVHMESAVNDYQKAARDVALLC